MSYIKPISLVGLPPSPPSAGGIIDDGPYPGTDGNTRTIKPLGVDLPKKQNKKGLSGGIIAVIVLSSSLAIILCSAAAWIFLFKCRDNVSQPGLTPKVLQPYLAKPSGNSIEQLSQSTNELKIKFWKLVIKCVHVVIEF